MNDIPNAVLSYLDSLERTVRLKGYLCLNENDQVVIGHGAVGDYKLEHIDKTKNIEQSVPLLEGLLPTGNKTTTVISSVRIENNEYFDIHFFAQTNEYWILFIDTTRSGNRLQHEQQLRLDIDYANDKRKTGS